MRNHAWMKILRITC